MGGEEEGAVVVLDAAVEGGALFSLGLAHPGDLLGDAAELGGLQAAGGVVDLALGMDELGDVGQGDAVQAVGGSLDLARTVADGGEGTGVGHGQVIGAGDAQGHSLQLGKVGVKLPQEGSELVGQTGSPAARLPGWRWHG